MSNNTRHAIVAATAIAAVIWFAAPVDAQRGQGRQGTRTAPQSGPARTGQAQPRSAPPQARPQPQQARPQPQQTRPQPQQARPQPQQTRPQPQQARPQPQQTRPQPQQARPQPQQTRPQPQQARPQPQQTRPQPQQARPQPQQTRPQPQQAPPRNNQFQRQAPPRPNQPRAVPYSSYGRSTHEVRRPVFVQPYFTFRPRFSLGFGIQVGYGVAYPFRYYDPFGFYNFRIGVLPGFGAAYDRYGLSVYYDRVGGVSFDIAPFDAAIFIDGEYVGLADDFSPGQMPLTLAAGRHHIDLRAQGFMDVSFDLTVVAGQVIPYQGTMPYAR